MQGQIRTVKATIGENVGPKRFADPTVWQWFVECCAGTFIRYAVGQDGTTFCNKNKKVEILKCRYQFWAKGVRPFGQEANVVKRHGNPNSV